MAWSNRSPETIDDPLSMSTTVNLDDLFRAALGKLMQGDYAGAEDLLHPVRDHPHPRIAYLRGLAALGRDAPAAARPMLTVAAAALPADAAVQANWCLCLYRNNEYEAALTASDHALQLAPTHPDNHYNRGLILQGLNRFAESEQAFARVCGLAPQHVRGWSRLGETRHALGQYLEAEVAVRRALDLTPDDAALHAQLSAVLYDAGVFEAALVSAERAVALDPVLAAAWAQQSAAQRRLGRIDAALDSIDRAIALKPGDGDLLKSRGLALQMFDRLQDAGDALIRSAHIRYAPGAATVLHARALRRTSRAKLKHDIEQFEHLQASGRLRDAGALAQLHRQVLHDLPPTASAGESLDLPWPLLQRLDGRYNRLHHLADAPRQAAGALDPGLDTATIEADYFGRGPGISWIDNLLTPQALATLRRYCMDSTFWFDFQHANGYLGAFFEDGFAAPLLLQVAEELRAKFPRIFGSHRLTQLWAFKYDSALEGIELHADIAAINLNFWITPDNANLDPGSGGLVVWDKEAPPHWGFDEFNTSTAPGQQRIRDFLRDSAAQMVRVPYRQNRAVLFNSDLFHRTDTISFAAGYDHRRINITMLFGEREGRLR